MMKVYVLQLIGRIDDCEHVPDRKIIDIYDSKDKAENALKSLEECPGEDTVLYDEFKYSIKEYELK